MQQDFLEDVCFGRAKYNKYLVMDEGPWPETSVHGSWFIAGRHCSLLKVYGRRPTVNWLKLQYGK